MQDFDQPLYVFLFRNIAIERTLSSYCCLQLLNLFTVLSNLVENNRRPRGATLWRETIGSRGTLWREQLEAALKSARRIFWRENTVTYNLRARGISPNIAGAGVSIGSVTCTSERVEFAVFPHSTASCCLCPFSRAGLSNPKWPLLPLISVIWLSDCVRPTR